MNTIETFTHETLGAIRTIIINGEPHFSGKDVAKALGYTNPQKAIRDHVDEDDQTVNDSFTVNGTHATLINESGMYSLILTSKLPSAKEFKRWVTKEVLPSIRKNGGYIDGQEFLSAEDKEKLEEEVRALRSEVKRMQSKYDDSQSKIKKLSWIIERDVTGDFDRKKRDPWSKVDIYDADTEDYADFQEDVEFFNVSEYMLFEEMKAIINSAKRTHIDTSAAKHLIGEMDRLFAERNAV